MVLGKHVAGKPKIYVYTSSGIPIASFAVSWREASSLCQLAERFSGI